MKGFTDLKTILLIYRNEFNNIRTYYDNILKSIKIYPLSNKEGISVYYDENYDTRLYYSEKYMNLKLDIIKKGIVPIKWSYVLHDYSTKDSISNGLSFMQVEGFKMPISSFVSKDDYYELFKSDFFSKFAKLKYIDEEKAEGFYPYKKIKLSTYGETLRSYAYVDPSKTIVSYDANEDIIRLYKNENGHDLSRALEMIYYNSKLPKELLEVLEKYENYSFKELLFPFLPAFYNENLGLSTYTVDDCDNSIIIHRTGVKRHFYGKI